MTERESCSRLDRSISDEALDAATSYYAAKPESVDIVLSSCFVFRIGREWLAIPITILDEVVVSRVTHALPHRRGSARVGLVSVRGDIIVHVSLAGLLGIPSDGDLPTAAHGPGRARPRVVILCAPEGRIAITVDDILGFHNYDPDLSRTVPSTLGQAINSHATAIIAVGDRTVGLLDSGRLTASLSRAFS